ncbi:MAG: hypothetical protein PHX65_07605 [Sulfurimonas sp.]|nr:hypothetical protein [Sulfurimonas sp.]
MAYYDMFLSFYDGEVSEKTKDIIIELVIDALQATAREIQRVDFWGSTGENSRATLQNHLVRLIAEKKEATLIKNIPALKEQFMSLTKENQKELQGLKLDN